MVGRLYYTQPVRGGANVLALALGLHVVGLGLTTDSRGYIDDLIDESDPRFLSFSRRLVVIPYIPHQVHAKAS